MKQCIICGQSIREGSHICPTCGFRAELPFFLSAAQYEQWMKACAVPYREQWDEIQASERRCRSAEEKANQLLQDFALVEILREAEKIKTSTPKKPAEPVSAAASEPESVTETTERLPDGEEAPNLRDGKPAENAEPEQKRPAKGSGLKKFAPFLAVGTALALLVYFLGIGGGYRETDEEGALCEYNADGNLTKRTWYLDDGSVKSYEVYEYDSDGNKTTRTSYDADGCEQGIGTWEYDADGNSKETWRSETCEYDSKGRDSKRTYYNADGSVKSSEAYEYDENGNRIRETEYNADGSVRSSVTYERDSKHRLIKETVYAGDSVECYRIYKYDDSGDEVSVPSDTQTAESAE